MGQSISEVIRQNRAKMGPAAMFAPPQNPQEDPNAGMDTTTMPEGAAMFPQPADRALQSMPEIAGLIAQLLPMGKVPKLLQMITRIGAPAAAEGGRELMSGEDLDAGKIATRTALNAAPIAVGKGATALARGTGGSMTRRSLARGMESARDVDTDVIAATGKLEPAKDVTKMAQAATREGAKLSPRDAQKFAQYANELRAIRAKGLNSTAQQAYLRARPEVSAALKRSGGNVDAAIKEFEGLSSTLARAKEGATREGFNFPRALAGAGVGTMVGYGTGSPAIGTAVGLPLMALMGSQPLQYATGQKLSRMVSNPMSADMIEAATRAGGVGIAATTAQPRRRRLESR